MKQSVTLHAYAKLNLGLRVLGLRPDGFHALHTHIQTIDLADELRFETTAKRGLRLQTSPTMNVPQEKNLVMRAMTLFVRRVGITRGVACQLRKRIPMGAGLGGGSSDAAATLIALDRLFATHVARQTLLGWAQALGSDVPFFLHGGYACVQGRGERIRPLDSPYESTHFVVVVPPVLAATPEVFRAWDALHPAPMATPTPQEPCQGLNVVNDLETPACERYPQLRDVATLMHAAPSSLTGMSGSGSAWYAVFPDRVEALAYRAQLETQRLEGRLFCVRAKGGRSHRGGFLS